MERGTRWNTVNSPNGLIARDWLPPVLIVDTLCHPVASPRDAIHHDAPTHPVLETSRRSDQVDSPDAPDARRTLRSGTENGHGRFE
ncbi:hypothetical protein [Burkholderia diffusa]|uniref:hypothetical protein n=1 Tax=Burkholderia diffusa TaxID=488732 RepID=UPI0015836F97|nr:hypothetical protein [Burkholderia diffusa]